MVRNVVEPERLTAANDRPEKSGRFVLYWMQAAQRTRYNHALLYAIARADALGVPVVTVFGLTSDYPEANARHYAFLLEGLGAARRNLEALGIPLVVLRGAPDDAALALAEDAALVVADGATLRIQRAWRARVAARASCSVEEVETESVVPVRTAYPREAWSAAVLRPRIRAALPRFLAPLEIRPPVRDGLGLDLGVSFDVTAQGALEALGVDASVPPVAWISGGEDAARERLDGFIDERLAGYATRRNEPAENHVSHMSPFLHFGHISPIEIALAARARRGPDSDAFVEELVVRRELSFNFCAYNPRYDAYDGLPDWARATLAKHARDGRPVTYDAATLDAASTHDPYWNAAQREMVVAGKMHNYMRMYWGKKILEWSATPADAFRTALALNNRYELDGRDANSFAGVAWCFGKHDRPWAERPIFGTVRYMAASGLERKFDIDAYVDRVARLGAAAP